MQEPSTGGAPPDYGPAGEARLRAFVEDATRGRIVRFERQVRWRPAWFVDVERDDALLRLHLRGDRGGDVAIFPDLKREADVIEVLGAHGIAVPRIHGYCAEPPCILMDALPGTRRVADAASDAERRAVARQYIAEVAKMHRVPTAAFAAKGLAVPHGARDIALAGLGAYLPHYRRTKSRLEPMLEFVIGWLRRNVPTHRTRAAFIQFDSGQFLFEHGRLTGLYDFEFSMVGDPMVDLATMRMRDNYEPLGEDFPTLCRLYEEFSGEPVDHDVLDFHTLQFATLGTMQFTGTVGAGRAGDEHAVYLEFDLALRQVILQAFGALTGTALPAEPPLGEARRAHPTLAKLADALARIETPDALQRSHKEAADRLVEWLAREHAHGAEIRASDLADVSSLLGRRFADWPQAEAALEDHVRSAGADEDEALLRLFAAMEGRRMHAFAGTRIGRSAANVHLPPTRPAKT